MTWLYFLPAYLSTLKLKSCQSRRKMENKYDMTGYLKLIGSEKEKDSVHNVYANGKKAVKKFPSGGDVEKTNKNDNNSWR